jgi:hypothetical protein
MEPDMAQGRIIPFPAPGGLSLDDLERLYRFAADCPGAQASVLVGGSRRTSAVLALSEHYLWIERDSEAAVVREAFSGIPAHQATPTAICSGLCGSCWRWRMSHHSRGRP